MNKLYEQFQRWRGDDISVFELNDKLHQFHNGIARELYKRYVIMDPDFGVAHALNHGILGVEEVREDLVNALGNLVGSDVAKNS